MDFFPPQANYIASAVGFGFLCLGLVRPGVLLAQRRLKAGAMEWAAERLQDIRDAVTTSWQADRLLGELTGVAPLLNQDLDLPTFKRRTRLATALGASLGAIHRTLRPNPVNESGAGDSLTRVWETLLETYLLEEAFDLDRGEIVTNARNFCSLLTAITQELLRQVRENGGDDKLVYCSFTPVSPKDWLNWPQGRTRPPAHHENWFIATFYRSLMVLLKDSKVNQHLEHRRYLLCTEEELSDPEWPLVRSASLQAQNNEWEIVPLSVSLTSDLESKWEVCYNYYKTLNDKWPNDNLTIVPMWATDTVLSPIYVFVPNDEDRSEKFRKAWTTWCKQAPGFKSWDQLQTLAITQAQTACKERMDSLNTTIEQHCPDNPAVKDAHQTVKAMLDGDRTRLTLANDLDFDKLCALIRSLQSLDRHMAAASRHPRHPVSEAPQQLLHEFLRLWHAQRFDPKLPHKKLGPWFRESLHSVKTSSESESELQPQCWCWKISPDHKTKLREHRLGPEFAAWGIRNGSNSKVNWLLALSASLPYPFEVTQMRFFDAHHSNSTTWEWLTSLLTVLDDIARDNVKSEAVTDGPYDDIRRILNSDDRVKLWT